MLIFFFRKGVKRTRLVQDNKKEPIQRKKIKKTSISQVERRLRKLKLIYLFKGYEAIKQHRFLCMFNIRAFYSLAV